MARISEQAEWLSLIDRSGPLLAPAVLEEAFPQGLEKVETPRRQRLRAAYDEWRDVVDEDDPDIEELHAAWTRMVLQDALEYEDEVLAPRERIGDGVAYQASQHRVEVTPDFAVRGDDGKLRLLITVFAPDTDLEKPQTGDRWTASPVERMTLLCRANGVRTGLVTNGEQWMLVNAPIDSTSGYASWFARLWWQEPLTLRAFVSLLGVRRCFGPPEEGLDQLLERSLAFQEEVTDTLGEQVRRAVEVLIQALGRADEDRNGELLRDVRPTELYEAGLTMMMRLVFILCAEERGLLLLGDPTYDQHYAVSTLRAKLREDESQHGPEVLERRHDAWSRMLSVFRAVYGGVEHEALRMPALGGSLFDPDRFSFLEGRARGTSWREEPAVPLPIDNRTVLLLLTALQVLEQRGGAQHLSYRALDVEQIGHVYEGLLEYTVTRLPEVTLGLIGSQKARHPTIGLNELESLQAEGVETAVGRLVDLTGRSASAIKNALERGGDDAAFLKLLQACGGNEALARRSLPFAELVRTDSWGSLVVYQAGSFAITPGAARRETGTHYTPRSLTETIVEKTLEPIVYIGPAEGKPREEWKLRSSAELLDLRVCDPAMGSGAFLVQVCRYLAERVVESWVREEEAGRFVTAQGNVYPAAGEHEPLPRHTDDRLLIAKRIVAERCLYGVDLNPLAVELAKLSVWLVTLAKGRPFGFLDHNFRCGDSLLGVHRLEQLTHLDIRAGSGPHGRRLFGRRMEAAVEQAISLRRNLREIDARDIRDVERMAQVNAQSRRTLAITSVVADVFVGEVLRACQGATSLDAAINEVAMDADSALAGDDASAERLRAKARERLSLDVPAGSVPRRPFHWPLEFPEVLVGSRTGFDAVVGNPPYVFGELRPQVIGDLFGLAMGQWDLCWLFVERAFHLLNEVTGGLGFVLPDAILARDEPAALREFVAERVNCLEVRHVGPVFRAGVSAFALCTSLKQHLEPIYVYWSQSDGTTRMPLSEVKREPKRPWNNDDRRAASAMATWPLLGKLVSISRGEEVGKKHLGALTEGDVPKGMIPVVSGAGVVELVRQPRPTHLMSKTLVKKKPSLYASPKIIAVKTGARVRAGIDYENLVTLQSAYNIQLRPDAGHLTVQFVCALLVSTDANRLFIEPITRMKKVFPQITQKMLKAIRVPPVRPEVVEEVTRLVDAWMITDDATYPTEIDQLIGKAYSTAS